MATRNQYLQRTQLLLNDPKEEKFNFYDLLSYVNTARGQVAGEGECMRQYATLNVVPGVQQYPFASIVLPAATLVLTAGVINIRMVTYQIASGSLRVNAREWEWFNNFILSKAVPFVGPPKYWAQFGQGGTGVGGGSLFVNPLDFTYVLNLDAVCYPVDLVNPADGDGIPFYWSDAVPYYAAYLALLTTPGQEKEAERMFQLYQLFAQRARTFATPSVLPHQYSQVPDPTMPAKLGIVQKDQAVA